MADDGNDGADSVEVTVLINDLADSDGQILVSNIANTPIVEQNLCWVVSQCGQFRQAVTTGDAVAGYKLHGVTLVLEEPYAEDRRIDYVSSRDVYGSVLQWEAGEGTTQYYRAGRSSHASPNATVVFIPNVYFNVQKGQYTRNPAEAVSVDGWMIADVASGEGRQPLGTPVSLKIQVHGRPNMLKGLEFFDSQRIRRIPYFRNYDGKRAGRTPAYDLYRPLPGGGGVASHIPAKPFRTTDGIPWRCPRLLRPDGQHEERSPGSDARR